MSNKERFEFPSINPKPCSEEEEEKKDKDNSSSIENRKRHLSSFASIESQISMESVYEQSGIRSRGSSFLERRKNLFPDKNTNGISHLVIQGVRKLSDPLKKKNNINFYLKYDVFEPPIGQGAHGVVKRCRKINESKDYAVKIIRFRDTELLFEVIEEDLILSSLCHPNIIYKEYFEVDREKGTAFLVTELATGSQINEVYMKRGQFEEVRIKGLMEQLCSAVRHLHKRGICHRDITTSNIIYDFKTGMVKLIDFNVSKLIGAKGVMFTHTGSHNFKAPELIEGSGYNQKIDVWSLGVVLYFMIAGVLPYDDQNGYLEATFKNITQNVPIIPITKLDCSEELKHLLSNMLVKDPKLRYNISQVIAHEWFNMSFKNKEDLKFAMLQIPSGTRSRRKSLHLSDSPNLHQAKEKKQKIRDLRNSDYMQ